MSIRNKVSLIGFVGNEPEYKETNSGSQVVKLSLGTHEKYKNDKGEKVTSTDWHNVVAFNKLATVIRDYVKKGAQVAIEGRLKSRSYENAQGQKVYVTEVVLDEIEFLDKKI